MGENSVTTFDNSDVEVELGTKPIKRIFDKQERYDIIMQYHNGRQYGHLGINKTIKILMGKYYWKGMSKQIRDYILKYPVYQKNKYDRQDRQPPRRIVQLPLQRNEKISMDIVGPLPVTNKGNKFTITIQDCLTKTIPAYLIPEQSLYSNNKSSTLRGSQLAVQDLATPGTPEQVASVNRLATDYQ